MKKILNFLFALRPKMKGISSEILIEELLSNKPSMIARFGSTEIKAILYPFFPFVLRPLKKRIYRNMEVLSGFLQPSDESIKRFSNMMVEDMKILDVLGSWRVEERFLRRFFPTTKIISLRDLEPYFSDNPWTQTLEGKKILIIHPFAETILKQYKEKRHLLFSDERILPVFQSLDIIKAVQTIANNKSEFHDWFSALEHMKSKIEKIDFDIAIIGCGAYGFPLAAHVKRIGKKAVHMGGATQILFGIKGKRWEGNLEFENIINKHFVKPLETDKPSGAIKVEDGCYW